MKSQYLETLDNILARYSTVTLLFSELKMVDSIYFHLFPHFYFIFHLFVLGNIRKLDKVPSTEWSILYMLSY